MTRISGPWVSHPITKPGLRRQSTRANSSNRAAGVRMNCDSFLGNTIVPINPSISPAEMWTLAELGEFLLARRADITRLWIAAVDRSPEITSSNDLTYKQLLDHLPQLCEE